MLRAPRGRVLYLELCMERAFASSEMEGFHAERSHLLSTVCLALYTRPSTHEWVALCKPYGMWRVLFHKNRSLSGG